MPVLYRLLLLSKFRKKNHSKQQINYSIISYINLRYEKATSCLWYYTRLYMQSHIAIIRIVYNKP